MRTRYFELSDFWGNIYSTEQEISIRKVVYPGHTTKQFSLSTEENISK